MSEQEDVSRALAMLADIQAKVGALLAERDAAIARAAIAALAEPSP